MKYGIISDIHSNLEAFQAVLEALSGQVDEIICLGDIVGYNPNPNECCDLVIKSKIPAIAGNHDYAVAGKINDFNFNIAAQAAIAWTKEVIEPVYKEFLKDLPPRLEFEHFEIVHGSPRNPIEEYIMGMEEAYPCFNFMKKPLCFVGHTHRPAFYCLNHGGEGEEFRIKGEGTFSTRNISRVIFNVGAVGQPRDGDPRAAYAIFDTKSKEIILNRVAYNLGETQEKMRRLSFPVRLIDRLATGS
jgi:predicted phosphodiesterase